MLIVDKHESHRSLQVLDYATEKSVILLSVPPHTTHKLQPLDRCVYGPLSTYFENEVDNFQKLYPSRRIQMYDMGRLFTAAYTKACTISNATSAFKKCGIWPFNRNIFTDDDFISATMTERADPENPPYAIPHPAIPPPANPPPAMPQPVTPQAAKGYPATFQPTMPHPAMPHRILLSVSPPRVCPSCLSLPCRSLTCKMQQYFSPPRFGPQALIPSRLRRQCLCLPFRNLLNISRPYLNPPCHRMPPLRQSIHNLPCHSLSFPRPLRTVVHVADYHGYTSHVSDSQFSSHHASDGHASAHHARIN